MDMNEGYFERLISLEQERFDSLVDRELSEDVRRARNLLKSSKSIIGFEGLNMITEVVSLLEEALEKDPDNHFILWCLGNAFQSKGFRNPNTLQAKADFEMAQQYLKQALGMDTTNELYDKSVKVIQQARQVHRDIYAPSFVAQAIAAGGGGRRRRGGGGSSTSASKFPYNVVGWAILTFGIAACVVMAAKSHVPQPTK